MKLKSDVKFLVWVEEMNKTYTVWTKELGNRDSIRMLFETDVAFTAHRYLQHFLKKVNRGNIFDIECTMDIEFVEEYMITPKEELWESITKQIGIKA